MTVITDRMPITISLSSHGGCALHFEFGTIWQTVAGRWSVTLKSDEKIGRDFNSIQEAYSYVQERINHAK